MSDAPVNLSVGPARDGARPRAGGGPGRPGRRPRAAGRRAARRRWRPWSPAGPGSSTPGPGWASSAPGRRARRTPASGSATTAASTACARRAGGAPATCAGGRSQPGVPPGARRAAADGGGHRRDRRGAAVRRVPRPARPRLGRQRRLSGPRRGRRPAGPSSSPAGSLVDGRVQGVFFRDTCRRMARHASVSPAGSRNRATGGSRPGSRATRTRVERMVAWCRQGPPGAHV